MTGYVNYFSATSLYAAWQAGMKPISPYVEAQLPDGSWQRIPDEAGFPAGLERTIVVDLTGKLPAGTRRIRLMTNLEIYWDQVLIDNSAGSRVTHHRSAARACHGALPRLPEADRRHRAPAISTTTTTASASPDPSSTSAATTRAIGDVTPLLKGIDDRYAIFGSGEEIAAEFDATKLPALPPHWKRDYFFYANGYVKDMDWWDASPFTVAQLPFHGMCTYPYPDRKIPRRCGCAAYQLNWNDRFDSGEPVRSYRFNYQMLPSTPADD